MAKEATRKVMQRQTMSSFYPTTTTSHTRPAMYAALHTDLPTPNPAYHMCKTVAASTVFLT